MSQFLSDLSEDDLHNLNAAGSALEYRQCNRIQNMSNSNLEREHEKPPSEHWKNGEMEKTIISFKLSCFKVNNRVISVLLSIIILLCLTSLS